MYFLIVVYSGHKVNILMETQCYRFFQTSCYQWHPRNRLTLTTLLQKSKSHTEGSKYTMSFNFLIKLTFQCKANVSKIHPILFKSPNWWSWTSEHFWDVAAKLGRASFKNTNRRLLWQTDSTLFTLSSWPIETLITDKTFPPQLHCDVTLSALCNHNWS